MVNSTRENFAGLDELGGEFSGASGHVLDGRKRECCEGDIFAIGREYNFGVVREIELWVG